VGNELSSNENNIGKSGNRPKSRLPNSKPLGMPEKCGWDNYYTLIEAKNTSLKKKHVMTKKHEYVSP